MERKAFGEGTRERRHLESKYLEKRPLERVYGEKTLERIIIKIIIIGDVKFFGM